MEDGIVVLMPPEQAFCRNFSAAAQLSPPYISRLTGLPGEGVEPEYVLDAASF